jgi:hypothetical protein
VVADFHRRVVDLRRSILRLLCGELKSASTMTRATDETVREHMPVAARRCAAVAAD